jgi:cysteine desulfuration protein SufE
MLSIKLHIPVKVNAHLQLMVLLGDNWGVKTIEKKIFILKEKFALLSTEDRYLALIEMGRALTPYPKELKILKYTVPGCQSTLYLFTELNENGLLTFKVDSDALISKGIAALLIAVYSDELPKTILETPPTFLLDLGVLTTLSPSRSNGLAHIHKRIKEEAILADGLLKASHSTTL